MPATITCDLAIVGGGLAGGLIALALAARRPGLDVRVIDSGDALGGNHVWSFFGADVAPADRAIVEPLVAHAWPRYRVRFPGNDRLIDQPYHSIASETLDRAVRAALPAPAVMTGQAVAAVTPTDVTFADGTRLAAGGVIDARGPGDLAMLQVGWQKFVGVELELDAPHGLDAPVVMDGTVPQIDGYRFMYLLPFGERRVFVEDTYYSDTPEIDGVALRGRIDAHAAARGWRVIARSREEAGALAVVMDGDFAAYWASTGAGIAKAGVRAGLFHPTTGYSLPDAVRLAALIAGARDLSGAGLHTLTHAHAQAAWRARGFYRLLDRMLFRAADAGERWRVLARFYRLPPDLISRFYAGQSTAVDKARILVGRPPVPLFRAIKALV
jgi:lycopene beta-cyclase